MQNEKQALKAWRTNGTIGKLHNIGTLILRTLPGQDRFSKKMLQARGESYKGPLLPLVGNITSWSSDAESSDRAFEPRDVLDAFIGRTITEERQIKGRQGIPNTGHLATSTPTEHPFLEQITLDQLWFDDWVDLPAI